MAHLIGCVGIPGSGKSHLARSAVEVGRTYAALTDPKERTFYAGSGADIEVIDDPDWRPHLGSPDGAIADGHRKLMEWFDARQQDDSEFVIVDSGTEAGYLAEHEYLKMQNVFAPGDLDYGRGYTGPERLIKAQLTEARRCVARGKTVIFTFQGGMKELEGAGDPSKKRSMSGEQEWRFDEQMLPITAGRNVLAQQIGSAFDLWLYTKPSGFGPDRKYYVTAISDQVRPAKNSVTFKKKINGKPVLPGLLPNTMKGLLEAVEDTLAVEAIAGRLID